MLLTACTLTYAFHWLGWSRGAFNDLSNKKSPKFRDFFGRYCTVFREVFSERYSPAEQRSASEARCHGRTSAEAHGDQTKQT